MSFLTTLQSVTISTGGSGYLVSPSVVVTSSVGGSGFSCVTYLHAQTPTVQSVVGTAGYAVNDLVTLSNNVVLKVTGVSGGQITTVAISNGLGKGLTGTMATNPVSQTSTSGAGTGTPTFNLDYGVDSAVILNAGSGYTLVSGGQLSGLPTSTVYPKVAATIILNTKVDDLIGKIPSFMQSKTQVQGLMQGIGSFMDQISQAVNAVQYYNDYQNCPLNQLNSFVQQYGITFPSNMGEHNRRTLARDIISFFRANGTERSLKYIFAVAGFQVQLQYAWMKESDILLQVPPPGPYNYIYGQYITIGKQYLDTINVTNPGTGYTTQPTVIIGAPPAGGIQASAIAYVSGGQITNVIVTNPGSGYTAAPAISFYGGGGSNAAATSTLSQPQRPDGSALFSNGCYFFGTDTFNQYYYKLPIKNENYPLTQNTSTIGTVTNIDVTAGGTGYTSAPSVTITGGGFSTQATAQAFVNAAGNVVSVQITNPGAGYTGVPSIAFGGPGSNAVANAVLGTGIAVKLPYINVNVTAQSYNALTAPYVDPVTGITYTYSSTEKFALISNILNYFINVVRPANVVIFPPNIGSTFADIIQYVITDEGFTTFASVNAGVKYDGTIAFNVDTDRYLLGETFGGFQYGTNAMTEDTPGANPQNTLSFVYPTIQPKTSSSHGNLTITSKQNGASGTLTFSSGGQSITRSTGTWNGGSAGVDVFSVGDQIMIAGTGTVNDGKIGTIASFTGTNTIMNLSGSNLVTASTGTGLITVNNIVRASGSWVTDGFINGDVVFISGTSTTNDGLMAVVSGTPSTLTLNVYGATLTNYSGTAGTLSNNVVPTAFTGVQKYILTRLNTHVNLRVPINCMATYYGTTLNRIAMSQAYATYVLAPTPANLAAFNYSIVTSLTGKVMGSFGATLSFNAAGTITRASGTWNGGSSGTDVFTVGDQIYISGTGSGNDGKVATIQSFTSGNTVMNVTSVSGGSLVTSSGSTGVITNCFDGQVNNFFAQAVNVTAMPTAGPVYCTVTLQ